MLGLERFLQSNDYPASEIILTATYLLIRPASFTCWLLLACPFPLLSIFLHFPIDFLFADFKSIGDGPEIPAIRAFSACWTAQAVYVSSHTATHSSPRQIPQSLVPPRVAGRCGPAGDACHARPLSCFSFRPSVCRKPCAATPPSAGPHRPEPAGRCEALPLPQSGHTAAHRRSRGAFLLPQEFCYTLALHCQLQLR